MSAIKSRPSSVALVQTALLILLHVCPAFARTYEVGPGKEFSRIGDVPWANLKAGDTVRIHYRPTPYFEKFLISSRGAPNAWIRVVGVPGPRGELPIVSGNNATTSGNMHYRWQAPTGSSAIQWNGVIQIAVRADDDAPLPGYIEIANLQVQDGYRDYAFTAENGTVARYDGFAACIYARSAQHIIVRNNILTNCGLGFFNWTGSGDKFWDGLQTDTVLQGNYFLGNGDAGSYGSHQTYTESDGVIIESNRFGPMRLGSLGSQIKDRSAGTVIRYNYIESAAGWMLDLVEPQESYAALGKKPTYLQTFVYGNVLWNKGSHNVVHWNEDSQGGKGRAASKEGRLFFYNNTVVTIANRSEDQAFAMFNTTWGAYDCPPSEPPGIIDIRNNIFAALPRTPRAAPPQLKFSYCSGQTFVSGSNWTPSDMISASETALSRLIGRLSPSASDPGFVDGLSGDFHLTSTSAAVKSGGELAREIKTNSLGVQLLPDRQYVDPRQLGLRPSQPSPDVGAFSYPSVLTPAPPTSGTPSGADR